MSAEKQIVLAKEELAKAITRMAHEVIEKAGNVNEVTFIGIRSRGMHIARLLARKIEELTGLTPPVGVIDVTRFRDDQPQPQVSVASVGVKYRCRLKTGSPS